MDNNEIDRVLRLCELADAEITRGRVRSEVGAGRWRPIPHRGVIRDNGPVEEQRAQWKLALVQVGASARLGGVTALQAAGLRGFEEPLVHVWVEKSHSKEHVDGVCVHESRRWGAKDALDVGMPRARPPVATVQAALWAQSRRQAVLALVMPVQQRIVRATDVAAVLERVKRHEYRQVLRAVIGDIVDGAHSLNELDFAAQCRRRALPEPSRQAMRRTSQGRIYLDVRWERYGVALEVNGAGHEELGSAMRDEVRMLDLQSEGEAVVPLSVLTLRTDPEPFFAALERLLTSRGWVPSSR